MRIKGLLLLTLLCFLVGCEKEEYSIVGYWGYSYGEETRLGQPYIRLRFDNDGTFKFSERLTPPKDYWVDGNGTYVKDGNKYKLNLIQNITRSQSWLSPITKEFLDAEITSTTAGWLYLVVTIRETIDGVTKDQKYWFRSGDPLINYSNSQDNR